MVTYLSGLKPTQVDWSIPYQYISEYNIQKWSEIQSKFAIKVNAKWKEMPQRGDVDWLFQQSSKKVLRVWGFNSHIESALNQILASRSHGGTTDSSTNSSVSSGGEKYSLDGEYSRGTRARKVETWRLSHVRLSECICMVEHHVAATDLSKLFKFWLSVSDPPTI
jgi:hypothetical protein